MSEISMTVEISAKNFWGIIGGSMGLFETGFRILISVMVISELAVDLSYLISQTEVYATLNLDLTPSLREKIKN